MTNPQATVYEIDGLDDIHGLDVDDQLKALLLAELSWTEGAFPVEVAK